MNKKGESTLKICNQILNYRGYAENTKKIYLFYIDQFINTQSKSPLHYSADDFSTYLINYRFTSNSQQNQVINAIKFLYTEVLNKKYGKVDFKRPRGEKKLPRVIDHELLKLKISEINNTKHKAIIELAYSVALRISEVVNLKISDIDSGRMIIHIRNAKGRKDRIVPLSEGLLKTLRIYFLEYKPKTYLFNGQFSEKYSTTSCRNIVKKYIGDIRFHDLRHSCATYLIDHDANLSKVSKMLGHSSTKTTEIYTHLSIKSLSNLPLPA